MYSALSLRLVAHRGVQRSRNVCIIIIISYKDHVTDEEVCATIQQAIGPHEDLLTIVKRRKLHWYGYVSRSSGLAKTILQGTAKGGRRQGRQRKGWEDNIGEWTDLEFAKSQSAVENRGKWTKPVVTSSVMPQLPPAVKGWVKVRVKVFNYCLCSCLHLGVPEGVVCGLNCCVILLLLFCSLILWQHLHGCAWRCEHAIRSCGCFQAS